MSGQTLPYDPTSLPRELNRHYISASDSDIESMLQAIGVDSLEDLYAHIPESCRFASAPDLPVELSYEELQARMIELAGKNRPLPHFLGDGLPDYNVDPIVEHVAGIRNLTTAYTPYQPERSQGTLMTHWIYQCLMSQLTGFEAINSSLYDRSTAIFEAMAASVRLARKASTVLVSEGIFPGDRQVIETLLPGTGIEVEFLPLDPRTGQTSPDALEARISEIGDDLAAVVYCQVNHFGILEKVDELNNAVEKSKGLAIAVVDPALLATGGLKPPVEFGQEGPDIIVGEAQHLAIGPNFGGPGLGLFGVRHNEKQKNLVRQSPGRYVGKAKDMNGRECLVMVLSTREQHIRKDKATSNICSNQAFLATIAGASLLAKGESGLSEAVQTARRQARDTLASILAIPGMKLAFPDSPVFNEWVLEIDGSPSDWIEEARSKGFHLGVDVSDRAENSRNLLKLSFSDKAAPADLLTEFLRGKSSQGGESAAVIPEIPPHILRGETVGLPQFEREEIKKFYSGLGELNVSPDDACYPLGSCTMKYNPWVNDWAANLPGFTDIHPQVPVKDAEGSLEILFEIQEWFKKITGLAGVTTQPVAGAQGELVGIKLFQAYHNSKGEKNRDVVLIPASAHGTNFATAVMAGFRSKKVDGLKTGIVLLEGGPDGTIEMEDLKSKIETYGRRIAGIMITNPNTCGVFENRFKEIADLIHDVGGLVYMDGANMNAIAGWVDLGAMGVDAVHNNLHKTWTIPHGGGGPGDAIVAVSEKLVPFLPGHQIVKTDSGYDLERPESSIGSFHRHHGNFAHKVRAYTYLLRLGKEGVRRMTSLAVLSARYSFKALADVYPTLPREAGNVPRMHEFILTLTEDDFERIEAAGVSKALAVTRIGKLFLDFGFHAPTVAWPETFGMMIEPTESYTKAELDRFNEAVASIRKMIREHPGVLNHAPVFTPVDRVDEVSANRNLILNERFEQLPETQKNRLSPTEISQLEISEIYDRILEAIKA